MIPQNWDRTNMQQLAELDLPHVAMETPEFASHPWDFFEEARHKHPWLATSINGIVVTEYEAIKELLWMDSKMRNSFAGVVEISIPIPDAMPHFDRDAK